MGTDDILRLGDKVQIKVSKHWYSTMVEGFEDSATFFVSPLLVKRSQLRLEKGRTYTVSTVKNSGLYEWDALVLETDYLGLNQNVPMTKLRMVSEPRRNQRRNAFRVGIMVDIFVRPADGGSNGEELPGYPARTLNISESGLLFLARKNYSLGDAITVDIVLNRYGMNETLKGIKAEVVRTGLPDTDGKMVRIGAAFKELTQQDRRKLVKFGMMSQRESRLRAK